MIDIGTLVGQGFGLGFVVLLTVWGLTIPFRWFTRMLGL